MQSKNRATTEGLIKAFQISGLHDPPMRAVH
jgi:hypothetical protein